MVTFNFPAKILLLTLLTLTSTSIVLAQDSLCVTKAGSIVTRSKCKKTEVKLNTANLKEYGLKGDTGSQGEQGIQGIQGERGLGNSDVLGSGQTVTGLAGNTFFPGSASSTQSVIVDLGVKAPVALTNDTVIIKANTALTTACGNDTCLNSSDRDATLQALCTGTSEAPTAPAGYVCIYPIALLDIASNLQGAAYVSSVYGFQIFWQAGAGLKTSFGGTWAYTAP